MLLKYFLLFPHLNNYKINIFFGHKQIIFLFYWKIIIQNSVICLYFNGLNDWNYFQQNRTIWFFSILFENKTGIIFDINIFSQKIKVKWIVKTKKQVKD